MPAKKDLWLSFDNLDFGEILLKNKLVEETKEESGLIETKINLDEGYDIDDLKKKKDNRQYLFLDSYRKQIKYWVGMFDTKGGTVLPRYTKKPCWSCHKPFKTHPLGCPIEHKTRKNTNSEVFDNLISIFVKEGFDKEIIEKYGYFETEGLVCSLPCMKNYLLDCYERTKSTKYRNGLTLMTLMTVYLYDKIIKVQRSGGFRLLEDYGGHYTIEELRSSYGLLDFTETINFKRLIMSPNLPCNEENAF